MVDLGTAVMIAMVAGFVAGIVAAFVMSEINDIVRREEYERWHSQQPSQRIRRQVVIDEG